MRRFRHCLALIVLVSAAACSRKPASIDLSPKKIKIFGIGNSQRMNARVLDKKGQAMEQVSVTWSTSKSDVVSIDSSGQATAKGQGKAMITASIGPIASQVPIEVVDVKALDLLPPNVRLIGPVGTTYPLQFLAKSSKGAPVPIAAQWTSSKPAALTVDSQGVVTSVAPGTATVIAKVGDLQAACDVTVIIHDLARLELRPTTAILHAGELQKFEAVGFGADGKPIEELAAIFQSSDSKVAKVDAQGLAIGVAAGTATIRATVAAVAADATLIVN